MASKADKNGMDISTIAGILLAILFISMAISKGGNAGAFIDSRSMLIVIVGTFSVTLACYSFKDMMLLPAIIIKTVFYSSNDIKTAAKKAIDVAQFVRKREVRYLEESPQMYNHNQFFKEGVEMLIDQHQIEDVDKIMSSKIQAMVDRHSKSVDMIKKAGEIAPAMGLIGTLIGLVQMLGSLDDVDSIGPSMAVALLTTFYGAFMAYVLLLPLAAKLERNTDDEILLMQIYLESIHFIAKRENPRKLESLINGMLPISKRLSYLDSSK